MINLPIAAALVFAAAALASAARADELAPTGTLRATFIATNPVQGIVDPATGAIRGPANDLTRELGKRLGVPVRVTPANGVNGVLQAVKNGDADIGYLAFDPTRASEADFSRPYSVGQNSFVVLDDSPLHSVTEIDRPGMRLGATEGDTGELFLSRTLKNAQILRNKGGDMDLALKMLKAGEIQAYGTNRQRLYDFAARNPGLRLLPDNFYGVAQSIIVKKGNSALLEVVQRFLDGARDSGLIAQSIANAGLVGVDVVPAGAQASR